MVLVVQVGHGGREMRISRQQNGFMVEEICVGANDGFATGQINSLQSLPVSSENGLDLGLSGGRAGAQSVVTY